jgi:protein-S-isoprenylcysteine O-methyltransferase Ste14
VDQRELQRSMYEVKGACVAQRVVLAVMAGLVVVLGAWLLVGSGMGRVERWLGWEVHSGDVARRLCLAVGFGIYFVRILFTEFVFLKRGVSWSEVFTIAPWLLVIVLLVGMEGGRNGEPFGTAAWCGVVLFVAGSWMNSYAEYARHAWKVRPENRGKLYTGGLFRYSRHSNYFGDLISFSGLCLIAGKWWTVVIPVVMLAGFVFVNIPVLDGHLREHYGSSFDAYARRTRKLIPFVY